MEVGVMKVLLIVLIIIAVIVGAMLFFLFFGMGEIRRLVIKEVDLSRIGDGSYEGKYHKGRWVNDVRVTVKNHRITEIKTVNKQMDPVMQMNEKIAAEILQKQSPVIDVVSGATIYTRSYQKAVENALGSALEPAKNP
jgi:uncharacterized protein with FMN-binding domain